MKISNTPRSTQVFSNQHASSAIQEVEQHNQTLESLKPTLATEFCLAIAQRRRRIILSTLLWVILIPFILLSSSHYSYSSLETELELGFAKATNLIESPNAISPITNEAINVSLMRLSQLDVEQQEDSPHAVVWQVAPSSLTNGEKQFKRLNKDVNQISKKSNNARSNLGITNQASIDDSTISTFKKNPANTTYRLIRKGYQDYNAGRKMIAAQQYQRALELDANSPDALLGVAALAYDRGNRSYALQLYRQVLKLEPDNEIAIAALAPELAKTNKQSLENYLLDKLQANPESTHLRFALGNLYQRQQQWPAAKAAYLQAYKLAPKQADYAYNLAVALDRLDQHSAARHYYRIALSLPHGSFTREPVIARVTAIEQLLP